VTNTFVTGGSTDLPYIQLRHHTEAYVYYYQDQKEFKPAANSYNKLQCNKIR